MAAASRPTAPRRARLVWLLLAMPAIAGAIALAFVKPADPAAAAAAPAPKSVEIDTVAQLVGATLDAEGKAALIRAEAIASSPTLRAAIQTDAGTLADMAKDHDIDLPSGSDAGSDAALQIFQVSPAGRKVLLAMPSGATAVTPPGVGKTRLEERGNRLVVIADAKITTQSDPSGEVVLTTPIDLSAIQNRTYAEVTGVELTGFGKPIAIGGGAAVANGARVTASVTTAGSEHSLAVSATIPVAAAAVEAPHAQNLLRIVHATCIGLAVVFLIGFVLSLRR
jgi:hypothetical protein